MSAASGRGWGVAESATDSDALAALIAVRLKSLLSSGSAHRLDVALTGGRVGIAALAWLGTLASERPRLDWSRVHLWWGDERFLAAGDPDRNDSQARSALIDRVGIPAENVHPFAGPDAVATPEAAAARYAEELASRPGGFDLVLLSLGPDGHIASLFPGRPEVGADGLAVAVRGAPKPPPTRVSLTLGALAASSEIWLMCAGEEKAPALGRLRADDPALPATRLAAMGDGALRLLVDAGADLGSPPRT